MYLGNVPAQSYTSYSKQDFTTSATTSYTLDYPVTNENEIALFINFVRQEPTTAYSASGTSLTLTSATSSSDDMYCVFLGKALQTVNPPAGSVGLSQLSATGTPSSSTFLRGDNSWVAAGGANTPYFQGRLSSNQTTSNGSSTLIQFDTVIDSASGWNSGTYQYTIPTGQSGKYFCGVHVTSGSSTANSCSWSDARVDVNGTVLLFAEWKGNSGSSDTNHVMFTHASGILNLTAGDVVGWYGLSYASSGTTRLEGATLAISTSGFLYKIIE